MKRLLLLCALSLSLSGCVVVPWIGAHGPALAAVGLVAGTTTAVLSAVNAADETAHRIERRVEEAKDKP